MLEKYLPGWLNNAIANLCKPEPDLQAQGVLDIFKLFDAQTIDKIKAIVESVDTDKLKSVMDMFEVDQDGWLHVKIDLRVRK